MKKIIISILTAICVFVPSFTVSVNAESSYTVDDVIALQDFLVCRTDSVGGKDYDLNNDNKLNVFDLILMKRLVINSVPDVPQNNKTLVAYYSASGTTERIAEFIADKMNADTFVITPTQEYTDADLDWTDSNSRVVMEHDDPDRHTELVSVAPENFGEYDNVFIGYPIWWHEASWVINDFVTENDFTGKNVIPFCTSMSSPLGDSGTLLAEMCGTGNWIEGKRFTSYSAQTEVNAWLDTLDLEPVPMPDTDILIAYFSRADENYGLGYIEKGNTEILAEMIADKTGGDLFHIETVNPYPSDYEECKAVATRERDNNERPKLKDTIDNFDDYDTIFLGYPIWYGDMPMAVYTFIESYDWNGKTVIPFNTHEGSGAASTISSITSKCEGATIENNITMQGRIAQNQHDEAENKVDEWLEKIGY